MGNVIGTGTARNLVDKDGDALDDGDGYLKVKLAADSANIDIGDVQLKAATTPGDVIGTVLISGGTTPTTFNTVTTDAISTASDVEWHTFPDHPGSEIQIQSASTNTSNILISKTGANDIGVELLPSTSIALPLENTDLLEYKLNIAAVQIIYITVLSNTE